MWGICSHDVQKRVHGKPSQEGKTTSWWWERNVVLMVTTGGLSGPSRQLLCPEVSSAGRLGTGEMAWRGKLGGLLLVAAMPVTLTLVNALRSLGLGVLILNWAGSGVHIVFISGTSSGVAA